MMFATTIVPRVLTRFSMGQRSLIPWLYAAVVWAIAVHAPRAYADGSDGPAASAVMVSARTGAIAPQVFSELGSFALVGVEAGYVLPVAAGRISIGAGLMYSKPPASGAGADSRLPDGSYNWSLDQQMVIVEVGGLFRLAEATARLIPYGRVGARMYGLSTRLDGDAGSMAAFGEYQEGSTKLGAVVGGGAEYTLGPGKLTGELGIGYSSLNEKLTGDSNTGALEVSLGYRLYL